MLQCTNYIYVLSETLQRDKTWGPVKRNKNVLIIIRICYFLLDLRAALGDLSSKTSENKFNDEEVEQKEDKSLLTFSSFLKFLQSYPVQHVTGFHHICCLTSQQVWISDNKNNIFFVRLPKCQTDTSRLYDKVTFKWLRVAYSE